MLNGVVTRINNFINALNAALATTLPLSAANNCIGAGIQHETQTSGHLVTNFGTGASTLREMGASFAIAAGRLLTRSAALAEWRGRLAA